MWRDALAVAAKDLRIERRSRVATHQVLPFALVILVLFGFALDPDRGFLARAASGLYWLAVLLAVVLAAQRAASIESGDGVADAMRLSGIDPAGVFLGKALAVAVELVALEVVLGFGVVVLYGVDPSGLGLLVAAAGLATVGLAAASTVYGALVGGTRVRETLLPLLFLPAAAPVLIAATRVTDEALGGAVVGASVGVGDWLSLLGVFAVLYLCFGVLAYGPLLEDA